MEFARLYPVRNSVRKSWDALQSNYVCCGGSDPQYGYEIWKDILIQSVPDSCCRDITPGIHIGLPDQTKLETGNKNSLPQIRKKQNISQILDLRFADFLVEVPSSV